MRSRVGIGKLSKCCSALRSTANDMLKYVSANLGLTSSSLTPLMEKTHVVHFHADVIDEDIGLAWFTTRELDGTKIVWKSGQECPVTPRSPVST